MSSESGLEIVNISKSYGEDENNVEALHNLSIRIPQGRFISIIGPSGCGKSTLFSILVGLLKPSGGYISVDGQVADDLLGRFAYMPQNDALLPWLHVVDNVALGLSGKKVGVKERREKAYRALQKAGLSEFANAYPHQLSGGMRQRAAFLRTLMMNRPVILLDEPFGALDSVTREEMQTWLLKQWSDSGATVVMVTHDVTEAVYLSDKVYVMTARPGRLGDSIDIDLIRPRPASIKETGTFAEYEMQLRRSLRQSMSAQTA